MKWITKGHRQMLLKTTLLWLSLLFSLAGLNQVHAQNVGLSARFVSHIVNPADMTLSFHWKDDQNQPYRSFSNLKAALAKEGKHLVFAMNGGIFQEDLKPLGLYIEKGKTKYRLNTRKNAYGNFYIQPNGVFYLKDDGQGAIVSTTAFKSTPSIYYATQSGPMLVINGEINSILADGSANVRRRNGVGILADGNLFFAISKGFVNFYDFAEYFKQSGCVNALYLDGSVSQIYLPDKNYQYSDGVFGVIIAQTKPAN